MKRLFTLLFCLFCTGLFAQMPAAGPSFFGRATFSNFVAGGTGDYVGDLTNFVDQTGHGWLLSDLPLPAAITVPNGAIFEIVAINTPGVLTANVDVRFVQGQNIAPVGNGYIGALVGPLGLIPFSTTNSAGLTAKMQAEIENYNKNRWITFATSAPCGSAYLGADTITVSSAVYDSLKLDELPWSGYGFIPVSQDTFKNIVLASTQNPDTLKRWYLIEKIAPNQLVLSRGGKLCKPHSLTLQEDYFLQDTAGTIDTVPDGDYNDLLAEALTANSLYLVEMRPVSSGGSGSGGGSGFSLVLNGLYRDGDTIKMGMQLTEPTAIPINGHSWILGDTAANSFLGYMINNAIGGNASPVWRHETINGNVTTNIGFNDVSATVSEYTILSRDPNFDSSSKFIHNAFTNEFEMVDTTNSLQFKFTMTQSGVSMSSNNFLGTEKSVVEVGELGADHFVRFETPKVNSGIDVTGRHLVSYSMDGKAEWEALQCGSAYLTADTVIVPGNSFSLNTSPWDGYGFAPISRDSFDSLILATTTNADSLKMYYLIEKIGDDTLILSRGGKLCKPHTLTIGNDYFLQDTPGTIDTIPDGDYNDILAEALTPNAVFLNEMRPLSGSGGSGGGNGDVFVSNFYKTSTPFVDSAKIELNNGTTFAIELDSVFDPIVNVTLAQGVNCDTFQFVKKSGKIDGIQTCNYPPAAECQDTFLINGVSGISIGDPVVIINADSVRKAVFGESIDGFVIEPTLPDSSVGIMRCGFMEVSTLNGIDETAWANLALSAGDSIFYFQPDGSVQHISPGVTTHPLFKLVGDLTDAYIVAMPPFYNPGGSANLFEQSDTLEADVGHDLAQFDFLFNDVNGYQFGSYNNGSGYGFLAENNVSASDRFRFGIGNDGVNNFFRMYTVNSGERTGLDWTGTTFFIGRNLLGATGVHFEFDGTNWKIEKLPAYADDAAAGVGGLTAGDIYETDGTGAAPLNVAGILMRKQ